MATLATFRSNIAAIIGLDNSTSGDQSLIDGWVNEGYVDVLLRTSCKINPATMSTTSGTKDYTLDTDILAIRGMYITSASTDYELRPRTVEEIISYRRNVTSNDVPQYYALNGADLLMLYPTPAGTETITLYYVPRPTALSGSTDSPSYVPSEQHKLIELYALMRAADYDDDTSSNQGERYKNMYEDGIREFRRQLNQKHGRRLSPAKLRVHLGLQVPSDPAVVVRNW